MAAENGSQDVRSLVGRTLGQYQIISILGTGGMAIVYKAYQPSLERYIALKVLFPHFTGSEFVARFKREALAAARLSHPNIVHVYDAGEADGYYYIAMEYIEGGTLKDRLDQRDHEPLDGITILQVVQGIGSALEYAHRQGIIHRDIKPANIMFTADNRVVLADLGLAKFFEATDLTQMTALIGTPYYMSPEQARSQSVDARSDIYSFGVVIYEMLTGRVPFTSETPWMAIHQHIYEAPPPVRQLNPVVTEAVAQVVEKALEKDPNARYQHVSDLVHAFATAQRAGTVGTRSAPPPLPETPARRPSPLLIGLATILLAVVVVFVLMMSNPALRFWQPQGALAVTGRTATATATATLTLPAPTATTTDTATSVPATATFTATATDTQLPTPVATATSLPAVIPPSPTVTRTATNTLSPTAIATPVPPTATATRTRTPRPPTPTYTSSPTEALTPTETPTSTPQPPPPPTATDTPQPPPPPTATDTPQPPPPTDTPTSLPVETPTDTPEPPTPTLSPTPRR